MKNDKTYTIWGVALRIVLLVLPMTLISNAWWQGNLGGLIVGIIVFALVVWWAVSYTLNFHRQGKAREAARQKAEAEKAERIHRLKEKQAELQEKAAKTEKEIAELKEKIENDRKEASARQAEFERTHGRLRFRVAGVTYDNDDGSSRQRVLKEALANDGEGTIGFESYDYKGKDAVLITYNDMGIGNVPAPQVQAFLDVVDRLTSARLDVERFRPEDNDEFDDRPRSAADYIYRADVTVVYSKDIE